MALHNVMTQINWGTIVALLVTTHHIRGTHLALRVTTHHIRGTHLALRVTTHHIRGTRLALLFLIVSKPQTPKTAPILIYSDGQSEWKIELITAVLSTCRRPTSQNFPQKRTYSGSDSATYTLLTLQKSNPVKIPAVCYILLDRTSATHTLYHEDIPHVNS